ncbi:MAG: penicillin-binding transpeptidase domain-containing protein, partial [Actinomycetota bacterium]|nr:penicillin-binding transpeptidase domain-containing protein [Actinomycetota bacterium]
MNRQIRQLAAGFMALYISLFVALNYWQVERQEDLNARVDNKRQIIREFNQPRGPIVTADDVTIADSVAAPAGSEYDFQRQYPTGDLFANVTGYYSIDFGATQLEKSHSDVLVGSTGEQRVLGLAELVGGQGDNSGSVRLTMRSDLQQVAKDALGERPGSVVAIEIETGAIAAMWSYPSYDPNPISALDFDAAGDVLTFLQESPEDPLLANAYQQRYMPGSTFKMLTTGIALEDGEIDARSTFPTEVEWVPPQTDNPIANYEGTPCGGDLAEVFARSCNIPFARTAVELGPPTMVAGVQDWGVGEEIPIDMPRPATSTFGPTDDLDQALPLVAMRGFGQNEVQMVPLHMAMVAATVANGGEMMKPYVVDAELDHSGRVLDRTEPEVWKRPISPENALLMNSLMQGVAT